MKRAFIPGEMMSLLIAYEKSNPLNPRTGKPWKSTQALLYFAFRSAVRGDNLDTTLLKQLSSLPTSAGDFEAPQGRPKKQLNT